MKKFFRVLGVAITFMIFLCSCNANILDNPNFSSQAESVTQTDNETEKFDSYVVSGEYVNIRKEPNTTSEILSIYYRNTIINAAKCVDVDWYKVSLDDSSYGYAYAEYVSTISDSDVEIYKEYQIVSKDDLYGIITDNLENIYFLPNENSNVVAVYRKNDLVELVGKTKNNWFMLWNNGNIAYINSSRVHILSEDEYKNFQATPTKIAYDESTCTLLGSYSTYYYNPESNRSFNLEKAADFMNGMAIFHGCTFNWCRDMGPCGKDDGYLGATEIVNGEYVEGYGGGICQVSSTLCAAIIDSGSDIELIDRNHHAIPQSYIPEELDATVSYPDCNFIFKNNNPYDILILTNHDGYELNVSIYKIG